MAGRNKYSLYRTHLEDVIGVFDDKGDDKTATRLETNDRPNEPIKSVKKSVGLHVFEVV